MATTAQTLANRENSKHSTGPRTDEGKAASSENAKTHGFSAADPVLPHEDRNQFNELLEQHRADFAPVTTNENYLVAQLTAARWKLDRLERFETCLLAPLSTPGDPATSDALIAQFMVDPGTGNSLARLDRYRAVLDRIYHRCLRELRASRKEQKEANSTEIAEKKFAKLLKRVMEAAPPGYTVEPRLVPVETEETNPPSPDTTPPAEAGS